MKMTDFTVISAESDPYSGSVLLSLACSGGAPCGSVALSLRRADVRRAVLEALDVDKEMDVRLEP